MPDPHYISQECKSSHRARIDFTFNGWDCWQNMFGEWGAMLSRKGEQPVIITRCATREESYGLANIRIDQSGIRDESERVLVQQ